MELNQPPKTEHHPFLQLLLLLLGAIIGLVIFALIGFVICLGVYGFDLIKSTAWTTGTDLRYVGALKILLTAQQIGLFLTPAIALAIFEGKKPQKFYGMTAPKLDNLALVFFIMLCAIPALGLSNEINQKMVLPDFLKGLEKWMREMEDQGAITTEAILKMKTWGQFFINLTVIAIVPAICEEFIFRGSLQRVFLRLIKNPHVAIWLSAAVFSAIHFQFYGFLPRLLLGAGFGYIYYWTGSIWYTVFAHFLNNGYAVALAFYFQLNNKPITAADDATFPWYGYVISAILTLALFNIVHKFNAKKPESSES